MKLGSSLQNLYRQAYKEVPRLEILRGATQYIKMLQNQLTCNPGDTNGECSHSLATHLDDSLSGHLDDNLSKNVDDEDDILCSMRCNDTLRISSSPDSDPSLSSVDTIGDFREWIDMKTANEEGPNECLFTSKLIIITF